MKHDERKERIESYGEAHQQLVTALKQFPQKMWHFQPSKDRWTIHEVIIHIADSEANSYIRSRRFLAEPGGTVLGYDEEKWAVELGYPDQSTEDAVDLFKCLRHNTYKLIKTLPESAWSRIVHHTEDGTITMDDWLYTYEQHIPAHIEQMQDIYDDWVNQSEAG